MNLLFICTVNRMRSCTAETIYSGNPAYKVRSAGISPTAPNQITKELLQWADKVFVMENLHRAFILEKFPQADISSKLVVLGIPDFYYYMEPELIDLLKARIEPLLEDYKSQ
ncbi:protein tyrosine phosphatase [bacterium]|nr:protein tyrosine phosphatase [bacterium]